MFVQIETLQIYCDVVGMHSFSKAAKQNNVTQSTASQAVQRLEEHLGVKLIDRSYRPWRLTDEGERCHASCKEIVQSFRDMEREFGSQEGERIEEVRVSSVYSVGFTYMSEVVRRFELKFPDDRLSVVYDHPGMITRKVIDNEVDLGILSFPPSRRDLTTIHWREEEMVVVCTPGHKIALRRNLRVANLSGLSLVTFDADLNISKNISQFLRNNQVRMKVALRFDNIEAIKRAVEGTNHVAILPRPSVDREVSARTLVALPFSDASITRPLGVIYRKGRTPGPAMQTLINILTRMN